MAYCCVKNHSLECDGCMECEPEEIEKETEENEDLEDDY